jgi:integrase
LPTLAARLGWKGTWRTMILVAFRIGLRRGEFLGLRWEDVDLDGGRTRVVENYVWGCFRRQERQACGAESRSRTTRGAILQPDKTAATPDTEHRATRDMFRMIIAISGYSALREQVGTRSGTLAPPRFWIRPE